METNDSNLIDNLQQANLMRKAPDVVVSLLSPEVPAKKPLATREEYAKVLSDTSGEPVNAARFKVTEN